MLRPVVVTLTSVLVPVFASGCGGGRSGPAAPTAAVLRVGGSYTVTKAYLDAGCGTDLASLSATVTVDHAPGAPAITIREGLGAYRGTLTDDGRFEAEQVVTDHDPPLRIRLLDGRFTTTGLEARNTWEMFRNGLSQPPTCAGALSYSGRRTSGANTFP